MPRRAVAHPMHKILHPTLRTRTSRSRVPRPAGVIGQQCDTELSKLATSLEGESRAAP